MGGTGIAVRDGFNLNYVNPASYGAISPPASSIFEMGFYIENNSHRTNELSESKTNGSLSNLNYWFKLKPQWSSIVGLSPYSSVSYKINTTRSLGEAGDVDYTYEGSGTISQLYWGNGFTILKNLAIGFNISYLFGSIGKSESIYADQSGSLIFDNKIYTNKFTIDVGAQYEVRLKNGKSLVVGAIADNGATFKASQKNYLHNGLWDTLNTSTDERLKYSVPRSLGFGVAWQTNRHIVAGDVIFDDWSTAISADDNAIFHDTWKWSAGYLYRGNPNATNYFGSVSLRAGAYFQNYHLQVKENILPWWGISAGISMPVFDNRSSINLTYSFNQLGTLKGGLILQRSQQIMVDVIVRDLWGMHRKFD
jgi:hypothetical protein